MEAERQDDFTNLNVQFKEEKRDKYKDVTIKVKGKHIYKDREDDALELITEAKMCKMGETLYLFYDESLISGLEGIHTRMKIGKDSLRIIRNDAKNHKVGEMYFKQGERFEDSYSTPMGRLSIELVTNKFRNNFSFDETGTIEIDYDINLKGLTEGSSRLEVGFV